jgi:hypothetical protein
MNTFLGGIFGTSTEGKLTAITRANQNNVNKAVYWGQKYNELRDRVNRAEDKEDYNLVKKLDRQSDIAFNQHLDYMNSLPKREQEKVEKFVFPTFQRAMKKGF